MKNETETETETETREKQGYIPQFPPFAPSNADGTTPTVTQ